MFRSDVAAASGADLERALRAAFDDASKAKVSLLIVDGLDTLLGVPPGDVGFSPKFGYSLSGGSFGSTYDSSSAPTTTHAEHTASMVRSLRALLRRPPPAGRRLAVVATTSSPETMRALGVAEASADDDALLFFEDEEDNGVLYHQNAIRRVHRRHGPLRRRVLRQLFSILRESVRERAENARRIWTRR